MVGRLLSIGKGMPRIHRAAVLALVALGALWAGARFAWLESSPTGFWIDESRSALHALCLAQTGHDGDGKPWPLFSDAFGGGQHPLLLTGFNTLWTRLAGSSIAAVRATSAIFVVLTCLGLFVLARGLLDLLDRLGASRDELDDLRCFPWLVLLAALLSPWSFQYSRIAWEGPLAPALLVWALAAVVRTRTHRAWVWPVLGGAAAGVAMTAYPPLRITTPLVLVAATWVLAATIPRWPARRAFLLRAAVGALALAAAFAPVAWPMLHGGLSSRTTDIAVFTPAYLDGNRGSSGRWWFLLRTVLDNLAVHLRPSYLFLTGDANLRHSPRLVGQLSPVDSLCALLALWFIVRRSVWPRRLEPGPPTVPLAARALVVIAALAVVGAGFGTLPAALTWDSLPHSLRSIGAWPFVALFSGAVLAYAWRRVRGLPIVLVILAALYSGYYLPRYFAAYRDVDPDVFQRDVVAAVRAAKAKGGSAREAVLPFLSRHSDEYLRYFLMHYDGASCRESAALLRELRAQQP